MTAVDAANTQHRIRLQGIDAPEIGQAFGTKSRDRLSAMVKGKTLPVAVDGHDRFGRVLAHIEVDGRDLGEQLVSEGMAWHYARFDKSPALAAAQRDARAARRGLWGDGSPVPPWEWRSAEKGRKGRAGGAVDRAAGCHRGHVPVLRAEVVQGVGVGDSRHAASVGWHPSKEVPYATTSHFGGSVGYVAGGCDWGRQQKGKNATGAVGGTMGAAKSSVFV